MDYKLEEIQRWRNEIKADIAEIRVNDLAKLQEKVEMLDKKNDKGFSDLNLKLGCIHDFMKTYREKDLPRIARLENGMIGGIIMFAITLAGLIWNIIWGHVKPGA